MRKLIVVLIVCLFSQAQAGQLEDIIFGPSNRVEALSSLKADMPLVLPDPISLTLGLQAGSDLDNPEDDFALTFGMRYNLFEIGPIITFYEDTAYGIYAQRYFSYDSTVIGEPYIGFKTTFSSSSDGMYAFTVGTDNQLEKGMIVRTEVGYGNFREALDASHEDGEVAGSVTLLFKF